MTQLDLSRVGHGGTVLRGVVLHRKLLVDAGRFARNPLCASEDCGGVRFRLSSRHSSCYGTISSLNGEPEQGVAVEAVGQHDCAIYGEDTVTDEEGKFRLRGLLVRPGTRVVGAFRTVCIHSFAR